MFHNYNTMRGTVVIFSTAYLPFLGGAETAIKGITEHISDYHFVVLTARLGANLSRAERLGNVIVYRLGFRNTFAKYFLPLLAFFKFIFLKKKFPRPILFWGMMVSYGSLAAWLLKFFYSRIPFLLTIQEGDREWERNRFWWRLVLKKADYVTAISSFLLEEVKKLGYRGGAEVVPNGAELNKFRNPDPRRINKKVVITVSRLVYKNGVDTLIKAFMLVREKYPQSKLLIIGEGGERKKLGNPEGVTFLGGVPYGELPKHLWQADVFVRPSRSEGLGTAFLEAMAAGLPVIATAVGGITDFLIDRETGLETRVDDPEDLAENIEMLFSNENLRQKLILNGRKLVEEKYQWMKIARDMEKIFDSLL